MRHSHATSNNPAYSDHDRPLTEEGRLLANRTASLMKDWQVDQIICSSATRTQETAQLLTTTLGINVEPIVSKKLYLAAPTEYANAATELASTESECVLIVGHNPGIASLICSWANDHFSIPPASVAVFQLAVDDWQQLATIDDLMPEFVGLVSDGVRIR